MVSMSKAEKGGISLLIYNQHLLEKEMVDLEEKKRKCF